MQDHKAPGQDQNRAPAPDPAQDPRQWHKAAQDPTNYARHLGCKITFASADRVEGELLVRPELLNRNNTLHGGAIMSLADNLGGIATFINLRDDQGTTTIESKTNFMRPLLPGDLAKAVTLPLHRGRRTQIWQTSIYDSKGKLAAQCTQTQMVLESAVPDSTARKDKA